MTWFKGHYGRKKKILLCCRHLLWIKCQPIQKVSYWRLFCELNCKHLIMYLFFLSHLELLKVVFLVFRNIGKFLSTNESKSHQVINSNIITLSFVKNTQHLNVHLTKPVNIYFKHTQEVNVSTPKCVFWDVNLRYTLLTLFFFFAHLFYQMISWGVQMCVQK